QAETSQPAHSRVELPFATRGEYLSQLRFSFPPDLEDFQSGLALSSGSSTSVLSPHFTFDVNGSLWGWPPPWPVAQGWRLLGSREREGGGGGGGRRKEEEEKEEERKRRRRRRRRKRINEEQEKKIRRRKRRQQRKGGRQEEESEEEKEKMRTNGKRRRRKGKKRRGGRGGGGGGGKSLALPALPSISPKNKLQS
ncbi:hypothetical protein Chor_014658, partial [Crotalus horridus]